jgi:leucyl aminopeptidase
MANAIALVRDLINTPAEDMGPSELSAAARKLGKQFRADVKVIAGDALLKQNFPTIHAVGRASDDPPRLIDLRWGKKSDPKVSIVGKGVCFDTGGLDLKPAAGMLRMKKDMGGGAHALGLASLIMALKLPVRLRMLVPAVENNVAGNAIRPLDVIRTRKGITVEIGNTDAEGRLVMCDALAAADSENPDMIVDFATLTGAARVAVGIELAAMFCNDDRLAADLEKAAATVQDPIWRLPLWQPYRKLLESQVADINNVSEGGFGGAITAALYLQEFVGENTPWAHFDIMAWNTSPRPGRPVGGEAQSLRAVFEMLEKRYR